MTDEQLHAQAREIASTLSSPDRKQLRFNEIVAAAKDFYPGDVASGVRELVLSCDRECADLYVPKRPMWQVLRQEYGWMMSEIREADK
jgi:hypothetical protein